MNTLALNVRLISAATAVATTLVLFNAVFSIAEPQRSVLVAKMQHSEQLPSAPATVVMASNGTAKAGK